MATENTIQIISLIEHLINLANKFGLTNERDNIYYRNRLYNLLHIPYDYYDYNEIIIDNISDTIEQIYLNLSQEDRDHIGLTKDQCTTRIIAEIVPSPSIVEHKFKQIKSSDGIKTALDWYYKFSMQTDYIKTKAIKKNQSWISETKYGKLQITINLSKPEKDPLEIAKAKTEISTSYPKCLLCIENEGYVGTYTHPARHNHRMLKLELSHAEYYFQYSPYLYYNEHSIIINKNHTDMIVNTEMLENFITFVDMIPHYLIGSNTDIPIVGGSILSHDHYQAGNHIFPIENAKKKYTTSIVQYPNLIINYLYWPISTLQLIGNKHDILNAGLLIINNWYKYSNENLGIYARGENNIRHNAVTPILRKISNDSYSLYLMLRNNLQNSEHPEGIFHPHRNLHHIKKENIGLIEAMGLAILPGRLADEIAKIKLLLLDDSLLELDITLKNNPELIKHHDWIIEIKQKYQTFSASTIDNILEKEIANKFCNVLEDSGVFKQNDDGDNAMLDFINTLHN